MSWCMGGGEVAERGIDLRAIRILRECVAAGLRARGVLLTLFGQCGGRFWEVGWVVGCRSRGVWEDAAGVLSGPVFCGMVSAMASEGRKRKQVKADGASWGLAEDLKAREAGAAGRPPVPDAGG
ncbi:MAG: hypothetical protein ACK5L2_01735, partial [Planctomyces sp.]